MLEVVEDELCLLEVPETMRCILLSMLEAVDGGLCLLKVLEVPEVMRCVLICTLVAVEGELCLREELEVVEGRLCLLEVLRCWRRRK